MMKMITERLKFADVFPDKAATVAQRLHIKKDEIPFVRKYYTAEKDKSEVNKKECAVVSYISTGIKDRDGEKLVPEGVILDNFQKNPIVPFAHDYKSIPPAKNMWIKRDEKGLVAKTVFAKSQRAEELYKAYTEDVGGTGPLLNAFSVGFIPIEWEDTDTKALEKNPDLPKRTYSKWELLEYSLVPIPSCAEALTIAVEKGLISKKLQKELEIEVVKDVPEREVVVEKDKPEFKSKIAHIDGMVFEPGDWCVDKDGFEWMWDGAWIGRDGRPAKKEISIKEAIVEPGLKDREIEVEWEKDEKEIVIEKDEKKEKTLEDFEYLLHHIEIDDEGEEEIHHCFVYDHIANMFEQAHLAIMKGKAFLDGKEIKDGIFHIIKGLEPTQEVAWSDKEAEDAGIIPKKMKAGMTLKKKSKEW